MQDEKAVFTIKDVVLEFEDFERFSKNNQTNKIMKGWRIFGAFYFAIVVLSLALIGEKPVDYSAMDFFDLDALRSLAGIFSMLLALFFYPWFIHPWIIKKALKKKLRENKFTQKPYDYHFYESGVVICGENGMSRYTWNDFREVKETKYYLAFYISSMQAHWIPKRMLEGQQDLLEFVKSKVNQYTRVNR
ncbi:YcxB family protein [Desulfitobacterium hafniense]|nr:YcxB family protein [Desulfitobacterium hafniense]EHL06715.1 hypothetical protein HMPREF0322_02557 [Desulfitobacterium hafniense DP7]KTE89394.1 hypothetical protein AT727_13430 [Desulfitobacterium hafniense]CDX04033.1 YcxB-like protein [Desulfitobacterium hafniense]